MSPNEIANKLHPIVSGKTLNCTKLPETDTIILTTDTHKIKMIGKLNKIGCISTDLIAAVDSDRFGIYFMDCNYTTVFRIDYPNKLTIEDKDSPMLTKLKSLFLNKSITNLAPIMTETHDIAHLTLDDGSIVEIIADSLYDAYDEDDTLNNQIKEITEGNTWFVFHDECGNTIFTIENPKTVTTVTKKETNMQNPFNLFVDADTLIQFDALLEKKQKEFEALFGHPVPRMTAEQIFMTCAKAMQEKAKPQTSGKYIVGSIDQFGAYSVAPAPYIHTSEESARKEVERLAALHGNKTFVYFEIKGKAKATAPQVNWA